jgi:hypothetical protein
VDSEVDGLNLAETLAALAAYEGADQDNMQHPGHHVPSDEEDVFDFGPGLNDA